MTFLDRIGVRLPIVQAPMAGVSTPQMAAAVSQAGALGSIGVGATDATGAAGMIGQLRSRTNRPYNVNLFVHAPARPDPAREAAWIGALAPLFAQYGKTPPAALRTLYKSFAEDDDMLAMLLELRPPVVSFHFGLPGADRIAALKAAGCVLLANATSLDEARAAEAAGVDAIVAQGVEAGGHRGVFDPAAPDEGLGTLALTRLLALRSSLPVIAAGGLMDGAGVAAALDLGAVAAQLGTAFIGCPESSADDAYRAALLGPAPRTVMTTAISGRPARGLVNRFTEWGATIGLAPPDYPIAYDAGKALNAAAKAAGDGRFGAQWAGHLVRVLAEELAAARA
jgi:nitronate monooxygenase